jgi:D-alanine--D-alanine ligase
LSLRVALLFGGPSPERGISLNSARSVADHLEGPGVVLEELIYFDGLARPYAVSRPLLYSNTPDDFDFKLSVSSDPLAPEQLAARLRRCDLAFPAMHGRFGEDGGIQALLDAVGVAYVGSGAAASAVAHDKYLAHRRLEAAGIVTVPGSLVTDADDLAAVAAAIEEVAVAEGPVVSKPASGGSSLGVTVHRERGVAASEIVAEAGEHGRVVVQPWVDGTEFTTVVIDGPDGPVALIPVEIELRSPSDPHQILSYRHKYLPSDDTRYHCPPRFDPAVVDRIRSVAERTFTALGLSDFARIDGWLGPGGDVVVSDVNPISGMEQNSFLFIQAAQAGMTHRDVLRLIVERACARTGVAVPVAAWREDRPPVDREPVAVLFGGATAERQVSVLSGTNVWLKLLHSATYEPQPALLDPDGTVWLLSYPVALRHTVEEVIAACRDAGSGTGATDRLAADIRDRLRLEPWQRTAGPARPGHVDFETFASGRSFVFNALHGGAGEDGTLQRELERRGIAYNGSGPDASAIAIDKYATGRVVAEAGEAGIATADRVLVELAAGGAALDADAVWSDATAACRTAALVVKPMADGCSAGVVPLSDAGEFATYLEHLTGRRTRIGPGHFSRLGAEQIVEMPTTATSALLLEAFVETDRVVVVPGSQTGAASRLAWTATGGGWVEVTVGVLGPRHAMRALNPSMTIATAGVLSLEEKFMGGTGVNITPPPGPPLGRVSGAGVERARRHIEVVADRLGLEGYARIDAFMHCERGDIIVIEANTLPGLTPSTVLYHQALAEDPPLYPAQLLERIIELGFERAAGRTAAGR